MENDFDKNSQILFCLLMSCFPSAYTLMMNTYKLQQITNIAGDRMDNIPYDDYSIILDVIKDRVLVDNEILYYKEYSELLSDKFYYKDITYCEARNLSAKAAFMASKAVVTILFDLVFVYEYCNIEETNNLFNMYTEKVKKTICIDKWECLNFLGNFDNLRCQCLIRDVRYAANIDSFMTKLAISVLVDIECLITETETIRLTDIKNIKTKSLDVNSTNHDALVEDSLQEEISPCSDLNTLSRLSTYISQYMSKMMEVSQRLNEEIVQKNKLIDLLESTVQSLKTEKICEDTNPKQ
jgi:hypothetical protein